MGNIYIEVDENFRVTKIHRMPFDPNNGMGYTREELERKGFFVEEIPNPVNQTGKRAVAMYNPDIKKVYYEYVGIPMSDKERIDQLENVLNFLTRNALNNTTNQSGSVALYVEKKESHSDIKAIGEYLAYQIISGKLDLYETLESCPQCQDIINETLIKNGIQV